MNWLLGFLIWRWSPYYQTKTCNDNKDQKYFEKSRKIHKRSCSQQCAFTKLSFAKETPENMSILMIDLVVPNGWTRHKLIHIKHFHHSKYNRVCHIFFQTSMYQGILKSTVSGVLEDLKFKISEGSDQNWSCPFSALLAVSV